MLGQLADTGDGMYVRANNTKAGLDAIFDEINEMEKITGVCRITENKKNRNKLFFTTENTEVRI